MLCVCVLLERSFPPFTTPSCAKRRAPEKLCFFEVICNLYEDLNKVYFAKIKVVLQLADLDF